MAEIMMDQIGWWSCCCWCWWWWWITQCSWRGHGWSSAVSVQ